MRQRIAAAAHFTLALVLAACASAAHAQPYPQRSVTMLVPFSAGGPTDTIARIIAQRMGTALGQTVVVENLTGAGGSIGVAKVVHAAPDGYTVSIGHIGTHVFNGAVQDLSFNALTDLDPVGMVASNPQMVISKNDVPAKTLKDLLEWVKTKPAPATSGTGGPGTPSHVSSIYFANATGAKIEVVHYRGAAPVMQDLIAGHIDMSFDQAANSLPQVRAGRIRAYAVTQATRLASAPDVPTVDEAGLPKFYMTVWHGLWVPKGTPPSVIAKLNAALRETLADPDVRKRLGDLGQEIPAADQQTPEALRTFHKAEQDKWWPMIKAAGIRGE
jgi:tripartite-type tricarboxylate transporter receptor subunit TctC